MKCRHCGNKVLGEVKYCTLCGNPVDGSKTIVTRTVVENPIDENKNQVTSGRQLYYDNNSRRINVGVGSNYNKSGAGCLIVVILFFLIPFIGMFIFMMNIFGSFNTEEYVEFGSDQIPTVYNMFDEKFSVCSYSSSTSSDEMNLTVEYCDSDFTNEMLEEYVDYLIEEENFEEKTVNNDIYLVRKSDDIGFEISIQIIYSSKTIAYDKYYIDNNYDYDYDYNDSDIDESFEFNFN